MTGNSQDLASAVRRLQRQVAAIATQLSVLLEQLEGPVGSGPTPFAALTERENQVVEGIVKGLRNREMAVELEISERTVEAHRKKAMKKLGARSAADLVRIQLSRTGR